MKARLEAGELEDRQVELNVEQKAVPVQIFSNLGMEQMDVDFQSMFERIMPKQAQQRQIPLKEARRVLLEQETEALIDRQVVTEKAVELVENQGIIFLDELDKICGPASTHGPDVSRQGVQRDLLPVVEGTTVNTRYGPVRTDHILFIAAGAFHLSKPSDLMPELQGRFPDPRRADRPEARGLPAHPDGAEALADQAVRRPAGHGRGDAGVHAGRHRGAGRHGLRGQPHDAEHRRPPAAHHPGARRGGDQLPKPRNRRTSASSSTAATSAAG